MKTLITEAVDYEAKSGNVGLELVIPEGPKGLRLFGGWKKAWEGPGYYDLETKKEGQYTNIKVLKFVEKAGDGVVEKAVVKAAATVDASTLLRERGVVANTAIKAAAEVLAAIVDRADKTPSTDTLADIGAKLARRFMDEAKDFIKNGHEAKPAPLENGHKPEDEYPDE